MAAKAYVLIETAANKTRQVVSALKRLEEIKAADPVTGPYDIIAVVEGMDLDAIGTLVTESIHPIPGIIHTLTCLVIYHL